MMLHHKKHTELQSMREVLFAEMKLVVEAHGLTRHDMAALTGEPWSRDKWSLFRNGLIQWSTEKFIRTARLLGVDIEHVTRAIPTPELDRVLKRRRYLAAAADATESTILSGERQLPPEIVRQLRAVNA